MLVIVVKCSREGVEPRAEHNFGTECFFEGPEDLQSVAEAGNALNIAHRVHRAVDSARAAHVNGNMEVAGSGSSRERISRAQYRPVSSSPSARATPSSGPGRFEFLLIVLSPGLGEPGITSGSRKFDCRHFRSRGIGDRSLLSRFLRLSIKGQNPQGLADATGEERINCSAISGLYAPKPTSTTFRLQTPGLGGRCRRFINFRAAIANGSKSRRSTFAVPRERCRWPSIASASNRSALREHSNPARLEVGPLGVHRPYLERYVDVFAVLPGTDDYRLRMPKPGCSQHLSSWRLPARLELRLLSHVAAPGDSVTRSTATRDARRWPGSVSPACPHRRCRRQWCDRSF